MPLTFLRQGCLFGPVSCDRAVISEARQTEDQLLGDLPIEVAAMDVDACPGNNVTQQQPEMAR